MAAFLCRLGTFVAMDVHYAVDVLRSQSLLHKGLWEGGAFAHSHEPKISHGPKIVYTHNE